MMLVGLEASSNIRPEHSLSQGLVNKALTEAELLAERRLEDNEGAEQMAGRG